MMCELIFVVVVVGIDIGTIIIILNWRFLRIKVLFVQYSIMMMNDDDGREVEIIDIRIQ